MIKFIHSSGKGIGLPGSSTIARLRTGLLSQSDLCRPQYLTNFAAKVLKLPTKRIVSSSGRHLGRTEIEEDEVRIYQSVNALIELHGGIDRENPPAPIQEKSGCRDRHFSWRGRVASREPSSTNDRQTSGTLSTQLLKFHRASYEGNSVNRAIYASPCKIASRR